MALPFSRAAFVRIAPFALFMLLLALRGAAPNDGAWGFDPRWLYGVTVLAVGTLLVAFAREYGELFRQNLPNRQEVLLAVAVGVAVFALWIHLDGPGLRIGNASADYLPQASDGNLDIVFVLLRWSGAALLVPVMEELFWRSFLMRWLEHPRFEAVPPGRVGLRAVVLSTFVFTLAHTLWLAAAIAGLAYAWLYVRSGKLWVPVISHAVTNGLLGAWVVATGRWEFW